MILLHATDLCQVPCILMYGLFSGIGRAPLAIGDERGKAYTRQIVIRQTRTGWEVVVLASTSLPRGPRKRKNLRGSGSMSCPHFRLQCFLLPFLKNSP